MLINCVYIYAYTCIQIQMNGTTSFSINLLNGWLFSKMLFFPCSFLNKTVPSRLTCGLTKRDFIKVILLEITSDLQQHHRSNRKLPPPPPTTWNPTEALSLALHLLRQHMYLDLYWREWSEMIILVQLSLDIQVFLNSVQLLYIVICKLFVSMDSRHLGQEPWFDWIHCSKIFAYWSENAYHGYRPNQNMWPIWVTIVLDWQSCLTYQQLM